MCRNYDKSSLKLTPRRATYLATLRERDLSLGSVVPEFPLIFGWGRKGSGDFSLSKNHTFCK
ncbi:hypothetical protein FHG68_09010 [Leptospira weilii]|nr:hypothetical protein FHG67_13240 [Leptospira weilii]QDK28709.1 hypothetical protein FHG68_09010 [Leptospira weilii]